MHARMVLFAGSLAIVCLLTSQLHSDEGLIQQSSGVPGALETVSDSEDTGWLTRNTPTPADLPRLFAEKSCVQTRSALRTKERASTERLQDQENSDVPQPLREPDGLRLPRPSPTRVRSTSPAPLSIDFSSELPTNGSTDRARGRQSVTETSIPIDANVTTAMPTISIETAGPVEVNIGKRVKYVIAVKNRGRVVAECLKVIVTVPEQVELIEATPQPTDKTNGELHFDVGSLDAEESRLIELQLVPSEIGAIDLAARASFSISTRAPLRVRRPQLAMTGEAPEQANHGDSVTSEASVRARVRRARVEVVADGPGMNFVGREAVYELRVSNSGDTAAENVKVVASLPASLRLTVLGRPVDFDHRSNTMTWTIESLSPGTTETLPYKLKAMAEGQHVQEITVSAARGLHADTRHLTQVIRVRNSAWLSPARTAPWPSVTLRRSTERGTNAAEGITSR